ncbi:hypothetical protein [Reinekea thalattae]|uniref:Imelysin family protein n=1 Tax=Reinekea thalattae TaxID=2593301 RepID=A0A5C8Z490_9GAMM|nr:hypothetical protein [Reinekea thalattae]TXR52069.1 hypothetical protein FME95_11685 [Reinekea thalattae]
MKKITTATLVFLCSLSSAEELANQRLAEFLNHQQSLNSAISDYCQQSTPSAESLTEHWQEAAISWYQIAGLQLPAAEFMQTEYSYVFWPDPKDRLRGQLNQALSQSPQALPANQLASAVKSLSAIEYIATDAAKNASFSLEQRCQWLTFISDHQIVQTKQLLELQSLYEFETAEMVNAFHGTALSAYSQVKEISARDTRIIWQLAPGWRSDSSWPIQLGLIEQLQLFFDYFAEQDAQLASWQKRLLAFEFSAQKPELETLLAYRDYLSELAEYVEHDLASQLDIFIGFNNFDGD